MSFASYRSSRSAFILITAAMLIVCIDYFDRAEGHARIKPGSTLEPRSESSGLKTEPCGDVDPSTDSDDIKVLKAGDQLKVYWEETINHPGWFRIAFSKDGKTGFDDNVLKDDIKDDQDGYVSYNDPDTWHQFSTTVTLPDIECDKCTIQLIQVMTDRDPPTNYYSCADIKLVKEMDVPEAPQDLKVEYEK